ncbi:30S ribosomal protein S6 [Mycoplasmopsis californica HAZ160_1]|uniref:Small ribosomal subunit protein bS6 n=1 Tax=Mycoplasmopsis californica HAZ160_1 TaxID=1397850 RepID=A0AAT9F804_9BACT|nr:30S ribosomal protein S6 [Mycoplasmopsis californica]BAP01010.1 30S ribosomal protein S6 [Mycoplasmopsis californica HAZ160_1]BBG40875.1 30S ribosomal protein S6 [Mycoplasmopsis californica]BBG41469.1 30S ribosomal protein S6 [Mycoplasmopsis californica]BBG42062.1 30S ribosomal protein S6 [Mycoplasmopsis californica]BBG42645.1 30S ribosomal protein S6 [Mycoplasmopsis californica]
MHKYEIMMILDPKAESKVGFDLVESVFGKSNIIKAEDLEVKTLAYPIKHSTQGRYLLFQLNSEPSLISEFVRRSNISKDIWRQLAINLDSEKGYGKERKQSLSAKFRDKDKDFDGEKPRRRFVEGEKVEKKSKPAEKAE